jgi:hypothetical protein
MDDNPYQAPVAAVAVGKQAVVFRVIIAALVAVLGIATGALAVQHAALLLGKPGPVRDVAMHGFPAFTIASVGMLCFGDRHCEPTEACDVFWRDPARGRNRRMGAVFVCVKRGVVSVT